MKHFFGTDGIRGKFGEPPITPEIVLHLGWAVGRVLGADHGAGSRVMIGKDTRVSGYILESALEAGLAAAGCNVVMLGPMPTPGIAYLTRTARAQAGIVISASHNPYYDNGIKFFSPEGHKLDDAVEAAIEAQMEQPLVPVESSSLGKAERFADAPGRYIEFCKSSIPQKISLKGLKLVVDTANGAAYHIAPNVFTELGADVTTINAQPDGFNINAECGSTAPEGLQRAVTAFGADAGVALDGDGDRVLLVDGNGRIIDGDLILYILGCQEKQRGALTGGVVGTVMSNLGLEQALAHQGIPFSRAKVGDRYVLSEMLHKQWTLGGESSGHIICLNKSTTGDGTIAALQVLQTMVQTGKSLSELAEGMQIMPQVMVNVRLNGANGSAQHIAEHATVNDAVRFAEDALGDEGRILVRPSGTEPVIRVMVEGADQAKIDRLSQQVANAVSAAATGG